MTTPKFVRSSITLADELETKLTTVIKPTLVCNPVDKNGEGILDSTAHMECYKSKDDKSASPTKFPGATIESVSQFGTSLLRLKRPNISCVPTELNAVTSVLNLDNFKCYKARKAKGTAKFTSLTVSLADELETKMTVVVKPAFVCNPADAQGEGITHGIAHLECFRIKDDKSLAQMKFAGAMADAANRFGSEQLDLKKPKLLCVPTLTTVQ